MRENVGVLYCGSCGALNPRTNHFCSACGHQLVDAFHASEGLRVYTTPDPERTQVVRHRRLGQVRAEPSIARAIERDDTDVGPIPLVAAARVRQVTQPYSRSRRRAVAHAR